MAASNNHTATLKSTCRTAKLKKKKLQHARQIEVGALANCTDHNYECESKQTVQFSHWRARFREEQNTITYVYFIR